MIMISTSEFKKKPLNQVTTITSKNNVSHSLYELHLKQIYFESSTER